MRAFNGLLIALALALIALVSVTLARAQSTSDVLAKFAEIGVRALKIEGRQRGRAYVTRVVGVYRQALDALARGEAPEDSGVLDAMSEGQRQTTGAYAKSWH